MKKKTKLKKLQSIMFFVAIIYSLILFFLREDLYDSKLAWIFWLVIVGSVAFLEVEIISMEDKSNQFNLKKIKQILATIAKYRAGTRNDFIKEYGEEMYNHFLTKGYIQEMQKGDNPTEQNFVWEITKLGMRLNVELR